MRLMWKKRTPLQLRCLLKKNKRRDFYGSSKSNGKMIEETVSDDDDMNEIDEHLAFLSRRFSKMKFKRNPSDHSKGTSILTRI